MAGSGRLISFVCFSLLIHLAILQLNLFHKVEIQEVRTTGIGVIVSSSAQFLPVAPQEEKQIKNMKSVAKPKSSSSALQKLAVEPKKAQRAKTVKPLSGKRQPIRPLVTRAAVLPPQKNPLVETPTPVLAESPSSKPAMISKKSIGPERISPAEALVIGASTAKSSSPAPQSTEKQAINQQAKPRYATNVPPGYPEIAHRKGWEGRVLLNVLVEADGDVADLNILESSGYRILDRAAYKAVSRWEFKPAVSFGRPVDSRVQIPINFSLLE